MGFAIGFGAGYYLGAMAGRERYEQINRALGKVRSSEAFETATTKAKEVVDLGVDRAKQVVEDRTGGNGSPKVEVEVEVERPDTEPPHYP